MNILLEALMITRKENDLLDFSEKLPCQKVMNNKSFYQVCPQGSRPRPRKSFATLNSVNVM